MLEHPPSLEDVTDTERNAVLRWAAADYLAVEPDLAAADLAAFRFQKAADRFQRRAFPGAVGAQKRNHAAARDFQRHPLDRQQDRVIENLNIVEGQDRIR